MMGDEEILVDEEMEPDPALNQITNAVLGAAIAVHRALGPGFPESVYQRAMELELTARGITFEPQRKVEVYYRGQLVGEGRMDFLVEREVIVDLKAVEALASIHTAQMVSYLRASHKKLGLLINFNVRRLSEGIKRVAG